MRPALTRIDALSGQYSCALVIRLTRTWRIRSGSTATAGSPSPTSSSSSWPFASVWLRIVRTASATSVAGSVGTGLIVSRPASLRARSSRSLRRRTRWRVLSRMISTVSACFGVRRSRSSISSSAKPCTEVSGLRSSCEAVSTNSSFIRSSRSRSPARLCSSSAISLKAVPSAAVSERPPICTRAPRSPAARRPDASTSSSRGLRIEEIRPLKSSAAPVSPAISPAPTSSAVSRVWPSISSAATRASPARPTIAARAAARFFAAREPVARGDLDLVGAGGGVLEVLALLEEAGDADHRQPGEHGEGDREADRQPVRQRRAQAPAASSCICLRGYGR